MPLTSAKAAMNRKENQMPTYVCSASAGRLTPVQKANIARSVTAIHHEETGAPRYLVQVIFYDVAAHSHYVAGQIAPADQIWIRRDIRGGRTPKQKSQLLRRIMQDVGRASGAAEDTVWVYLSEIPSSNIAEYGRALLPPGEEDAWFSTLPHALQETLGPLA
jgi:phenylpyruvate tautomerase PptA (4-oxalocrotonate tautomerase family)